MRVFSQINNCQQKQNKTKQKNRQNKKGAPLLGLAKSIYYTARIEIFTNGATVVSPAFIPFR